MTIEGDNAKGGEAGGTLFLVNAAENPDACIEESSFQDEWQWVTAPADWTPEQGLPDGKDAAAFDAIVVFSKKYEEDAIRELCEAIHQAPHLRSIPLLVAVNQYEMPLANRVKKMPNSDFVFAPIKQDELRRHLKRAIRGRDDSPGDTTVHVPMP